MSQSTNKSRGRPPLSLGQGGGGGPRQANNGRKASSDSTDSTKLSAPVVVLGKISASDLSNATAPFADDSKTKPNASATNKEKARENGGSAAAKNGSGAASAKNGNGAAAGGEKAVAAVAPTQKDGVKEAKKVDAAEKKEDKKETPKKDERAAAKTDGGGAKTVEHTETVRESPRQKDIREAREKEELAQSKLQEQKEIDAALAVFRAQEEAELLAAAAATVPAVATPDVKPVESPKKRASTTATPVKESVAAAGVVQHSTPTRAALLVTDPSKSLLEQSELYGFGGADVDDMEALVMDTDPVVVDSPMPKSAQKATGKILKFAQSPAANNRARVSPFRRATAAADTNASTLVNLSTVSEMSTEASNSPALIGVGESIVPGEQSYGSYHRLISGRKNIKPLRELTMRESYRRIKTDLDDSISSCNATMGSEINNDSFRTPVVAIKGRKRTNIGGSEPDLNAATTDSPKKARLDFSGFLCIMASPVTLLRNKFSRTSLLCSTPNGKKLNVDAPADQDDEEKVVLDAENGATGGGVEDVVMVEVDLTNETDREVVDVVAASVTNKFDDSLDVVPIEANEIVIETEKLASVDDIKDKIAEEEARQDEAAAALAATDASKKGRCVVM